MRIPESTEVKFLGFQKTRRHAVIAIKFYVVEGSSDAVPTGHGSGLDAAHARHREHDYVSQAHGFADQDDFELNRSTGGQFLRRKEINARRTDVPGHEPDGMFLRHATDTAEAQGQLERGARIFPLLRMRPHGMRRDANETARLRGTQEWRQAQHRRPRSFGQGSRNTGIDASVRGSIGGPLLNWNCALCGAHFSPRDDTTRSLERTQQT